jgi:hypothetical protein
MASRINARTIRNLAPVLVPLVTRVAVPMAIRSMRRGGNGMSELFDDARDQFGKNVKKTRADLEDVRDEAVERGRKLYDDALKHGSELLDMISSKGISAAEEWASSLGRPKRRFPWGKLLLASAVVGVGYLYLTRD